MSYVVEQGQDENGTWYRRFSNGWVEQGGYAEYAGTTRPIIVFPIEFYSNDYSVTIGAESREDLFGTASICTFGNKEPSKMIVYVGSKTVGCFWEAKGFAA